MPGRRRGGSPESEDLSGSSYPEPLAEGRIQVLRSLVLLAGTARCCTRRLRRRSVRRRGRLGLVPGHRDRLERQGHGLRSARRASSRSRRRRPRRSSQSEPALRSSPSTTSPTFRRQRRRRRSPASRRTSRRSRGIAPTSSSSHTTRRACRAHCERLGITVLHHDGAKSFKGAYQQIRQLGLVTGRESRAVQPHRIDENEDREDRR